MDQSSYLKDIEGSKIIKDKIDFYTELVEKIIPSGDEIVDIFITNKKSGEKYIFDSLFFFTNYFVMESKEFLSSNVNIDNTYFKGFIGRYEINSRNFDILKNVSNPESFINVNCFIDDVVVIMNSYGKNCEYLWKIIEKHIIPNIWFDVKGGVADT